MNQTKNVRAFVLYDPPGNEETDLEWLRECGMKSETTQRTERERKVLRYLVVGTSFQRIFLFLRLQGTWCGRRRQGCGTCQKASAKWIFNQRTFAIPQKVDTIEVTHAGHTRRLNACRGCLLRQLCHESSSRGRRTC